MTMMIREYHNYMIDIFSMPVLKETKKFDFVLYACVSFRLEEKKNEVKEVLEKKPKHYKWKEKRKLNALYNGVNTVTKLRIIQVIEKKN